MKRKNIYLFSVALVIALSCITFSRAQQAGMEIIPTWTAKNLYPSDYRGKPLPSKETPVSVSVEILKNGKIVDGSGVSIEWYIDNKFYKKGLGLKNIMFYVSNRPGNSHFVRIVATDGSLSTSKMVEVPVQDKEIVVENNFGGVTIPADSSVSFVAVPYFFNVSSITDLKISWKIQSREIPGENKNMLFVQFGKPQNESQHNVKVSALAKEEKNLFQKAEGFSQLRIE